MMNPYNEAPIAMDGDCSTAQDRNAIYYYVSRRSDLTHLFGWIYWVKRPLGVCAAAKQELKPKTPHLPRHARHIFAYP